MEITYSITEAEYKKAFKLRFQKTGILSGVKKTILFWIFILICLMLLWAVVQRGTNPAKANPPTPAASSPARSVSEQQAVPDKSPSQTPCKGSAEPTDNVSLTRALLFNLGPFVLLAGLWIAMLSRLGPGGLRGTFSRDPLMQGQFTVAITSSSISTRNTVGYSMQAGWNIYDYWKERSNLLILVMKSGAYFIVSLASLSDPQRDELRAVLTTALPKK